MEYQKNLNYTLNGKTISVNFGELVDNEFIENSGNSVKISVSDIKIPRVINESFVQSTLYMSSDGLIDEHGNKHFNPDGKKI